MPGDIPVLHVDRGGQVTYHGPGQIVVYPLLDLKRLKIGVRDYVCRIEQAVIDTLAEWNIGAQRRGGAPGVYVNDAKVAALGIRVRHGCTFHGLAFNAAMDQIGSAACRGRVCQDVLVPVVAVPLKKKNTKNTPTNVK